MWTSRGASEVNWTKLQKQLYISLQGGKKFSLQKGLTFTTITLFLLSYIKLLLSLGLQKKRSRKKMPG
ncbi:Hypothetical protein FKW44_002461 [Caligus rogercresseyi]|uniref:Uncharacterized protein n=1 Tax=Caligus rogercresseyi TaxID=217165 RepID=A0A7T8QWB6_CALRO|nr:Hypothetical protein FKW44_002461 [Caligus rogercresseyi]